MKDLSLIRHEGKKHLDGVSDVPDLVAEIARLRQLHQTSVHMMEIQTIAINPIFSRIFPIREAILVAVTESIKENGFDEHQPLILWKKTGEIIDGHTRFFAAKKNNLVNLPVLFIDLPHTQAVEEYIYTLQFKRRNLTVADRLIFLISYLQTHDRPPHYREWIHRLFGTSLGNATKYIALVDHQDSPVFDRVLSGELTLNAAYDRLMSKKTSTPRPDSVTDVRSLNTFFDEIHNSPQAKMHLSLLKSFLHILSTHRYVHKSIAAVLLQKIQEKEKQF